MASTADRISYVLACRTRSVSHAAVNCAVLKYFGRTEEDFPSATVADIVAIFEDNLESFFLGHWAEWITACNNV